jgi:hypothetical protein
LSHYSGLFVGEDLYSCAMFSLRNDFGQGFGVVVGQWLGTATFFFAARDRWLQVCLENKRIAPHEANRIGVSDILSLLAANWVLAPSVLWC